MIEYYSDVNKFLGEHTIELDESSIFNVDTLITVLTQLLNSYQSQHEHIVNESKDTTLEKSIPEIIHIIRLFYKQFGDKEYFNLKSKDLQTCITSLDSHVKLNVIDQKQNPL